MYPLSYFPHGGNDLLPPWGKVGMGVIKTDKKIKLLKDDTHILYYELSIGNFNFRTNYKYESL
jgi:hypothetical protein